MKEYVIFWSDYKDIRYDKNVSVHNSLQVAIREADMMHEADKEQFDCNQYAVYEFKDKELIKKVYETKMQEHVNLLNQFLRKQLKEEIAEFKADRKKLIAQRKQMAAEVQSVKESTKKQYAAKLAKLEEFVIKNLSEEIAEFQIDKKALS